MKREAKIGVFAVTMILAAWAGIRFLSGLDIFSRNADYVAAYDQVSGLQKASSVMMKGVKIGTVSAIEFDPAASDKVYLHLLVKRSYRIPSDSEARIFSDGFLGGKAIEIVYGSEHTYLESGDTIRSSRDRDLMDVAGSELDFFKQRFSRLTDDLSRTLGNLNAILEANAGHFETTMGNLEQLSGDASELLRSEKQHLAAIAGELAAFSTMLGENAGRVDTLIGGLSRFAADLEAQAVVEKLAGTLDGLQQIVEKAGSGEGTVGRLLDDPALYDELAETSRNLSALLADLKARPGRYVHLSLFGRDPEKAERKAEKKAARQAAREAKRAANAQEQ